MTLLYIYFNNLATVLESFDKPTEHINFRANGAQKMEFTHLHRVDEHFEYRAMQKLAHAGGFAKPSFSDYFK